MAHLVERFAVEERTPMIFNIRRVFVWSLGFLLLLLFVLEVVCLVQDEPAVKLGLLGIIILVVSALFAASLSRKLEVHADRVVLHRFGRTKTLMFSDVSAVESLVMRKRVFFTFCAGDDFIILSNAYDRFAELVEVLLSRVSAQIISDDVRRVAAAPPVRHGDILSCWLGIVLVLVILWHQLATHFG